MKRFLFTILFLLLPFLIPQTSFAATHNHAMHGINMQADDHTFHIVLPIIALLLFSLYFFKDKLLLFFKYKESSRIRLSLASFLAILVIFAIFITHVIPSYMIVTVHHSDGKHSSSEHHPCCAPGLASVSIDPLEDVSFTSSRQVVLRPETVFLQPHKSSRFNKSPPLFS